MHTSLAPKSRDKNGYLKVYIHKYIFTRCCIHDAKPKLIAG
jgi:hypothetical protein